MRRKWFIGGVAALILALTVFLIPRDGRELSFSQSSAVAPSNNQTTAAAPENPDEESVEKIILAAPGRVEGAGETVEIGSGADGVLAAVPVVEGQKISVGQVVAIVSCEEINGEIEAGRAAVERARYERERLLRGSRPEERERAKSEVIAAESVLNHARLHFERMSRLVADGVIARAELDTARRDYELAQANVRSAREREKLVNAPPLPEEVGRVDAEIREAGQKVKAAAARLDKYTIKSPMSGTILRVYLRPGETVSAVNPRPIVSLADVSSLRVRAEVDERDIGRVMVGQKARLTVDAYPERKFSGRVVSVGDTMGRKKARTGDPAEKSDRDVLDVLIEVDKTDSRLVVGLRVTAQFLSE